MKKLFSLIFVLALALCMATTAFAASVVTADMWDPTVAMVVTVPADGTAKVKVMNSGFDLLISGKGEYTVTYNGQNVEIAGGVATVEDVEATRFTPSTVTINNLSGAVATYTLIGRYPLGAWSNPAELALGENVAEIEAGIQSYYLDWTAPASGVLTITMPTDMDWFFTYSNFGADREDGLGDTYGEEHYSTDDANVFEIQVKAGDLLELQVNTYDPEDSYNTPAGTVTFGAELEIVHSNVIHFDAVEPGCHSNGNIEYWFCADCEGFWQDEALTQVTNSKRVILPATGSENVVHFDAVEPGCHSNGNIEYWFCADCEGFWQDEALTQVTNSKRVILPATGSENVVHFEAVEPGCHSNGNIEYWFCPDCEGFWQDEALTQVTNSKRVNLPATGSENVVHFEAVEPACHYNGNIEYWFCPDCEGYWQDAALTQLTNSKRVILPALGSEGLVHVEAVAPSCEATGNIEYWFCPDCECYWQNEALTQLTNSKRVILPEAEHDFVGGKCTACGEDANDGNNPDTGDAGFLSVVVTMLTSAMGTVALIAKKKEF